MNIALGGLIGAVLGAGVWIVAAQFVGRTRPWRQGAGAKGSVPLPVAATLAGMAVWGAFVGWQISAGVPRAAAALVIAALLAAITLVDLQVRQIPNALVLALLGWAAVQVLVVGRPAALAAGLGLLGGCTIFAVVALISRGAMGAGDVKLAGALGAVLGWPLVLPALLYGIIAGGLAALALLVTRRAGRRSCFAYGPYLALGAVVVLAQQMCS